jgi:hypothetical protein
MSPGTATAPPTEDTCRATARALQHKRPGWLIMWGCQAPSSPPPAAPDTGTSQPVTGSQHTPPRPRHPCPRPPRHHRKQPHGWQPW